MTNRIRSIDFLRGVVMLIMTVDHTRDMFHSVLIQAMIDANVPWGLFLTRWISHFCAPTFVFLAGLSVALKMSSLSSEQGCRSARWFLFKRGFFLVLLEFTIVNLCFSIILGDQHYMMRAQVIWAIGMSMIFLALLSVFPARSIAAVGILILLSSNYFDRFNGTDNILWNFIHVRTTMPITETLSIRSTYPLYPWLGLIALGYSFGIWLWSNHVTPLFRKRTLLLLAGLSWTAFVLLRFTNLYGDPALFVSGADATAGLQSFLNTTKYPPSLQFLLMTLPLSFLILALMEKTEGRLVDIVSQYGSAPLFYYVAHLCLIPIVNFVMAILIGVPRYTTDQLWISWMVAVGIAVVLYPVVGIFITFRRKNKRRFPLLEYV